MKIWLNAFLILLPITGSVCADPISVSVAQPEVTAIDILLEPDTTMLEHAEANNSRLRNAFPRGFALDAEHRPHITMLQLFVRTEELQKVYVAVESVLERTRLKTMRLEAYKYYYAPVGALGIAGICARPTSQIVDFQANIIAAVKPFMSNSGTIDAFTRRHEDPATDASMVAYVLTFVPKMSGENFNPHVSTGVAPTEYLDKMLEEPFVAFTFAPSRAAVYQLGPFGTAAKKLKQWELTR